MSFNLLLGIVAAIVVVGGGAYVAMNPEIIMSISGGSAEEGEEAMENKEGASVGNTFANLVALGQSVTCTFSHDDGAGNRSSGTVYMTGGATQMRGDFTVEASGTAPVETFMVRTGGYTYIWSDASPQGIKSQVINETELMSDDQNGGIDEDTEFSCQAWSVDTAKFSLPNGIQFTDMSAQIDAMMEASGIIQ